MDRISLTLYINLDKRPGKRKAIEAELSKFALPKVERFAAIARRRGYVGCSESHIGCLEKAMAAGCPNVFICEDDFQCLNPARLNASLAAFLDSGTEWDVIVLCGNVLRPATKHSDVALRIHNCQTTAGYIVAKHYMPTLLTNFRQGLAALKARDRRSFCIDMHWKALQRRDRWFCLQPFTCIQRPGMSDIEGRHVNYSSELLKIG